MHDEEARLDLRRATWIGSLDPEYDPHRGGRDTERALTGILDERAREILRLRFQDDLLQSEIAERVGCSQMHVSRIIRGSLEKLYAYGAGIPPSG